MLTEKERKGMVIRMKNEMKMEFDAISANEAFARVAVAAFVSELDPTLEEVSDIKTAVSEAVTNAIIHGYDDMDGGKVNIRCVIEQDVLHVEVMDKGKGIGYRKGDGAALYYETGTEPLWDGIPIYGSFYG